jgi:hypothetical protein
MLVRAHMPPAQRLDALPLPLPIPLTFLSLGILLVAHADCEGLGSPADCYDTCGVERSEEDNDALDS